MIPDGWLTHESNFQPFDDFLYQGNEKHIFQRRKKKAIYYTRFYTNFCSKIEPFGWTKLLQACIFCKNNKTAAGEYSLKKHLCYSAISYSQGLSPAFNPTQTCTKNLTEAPSLDEEIDKDTTTIVPSTVFAHPIIPQKIHLSRKRHNSLLRKKGELGLNTRLLKSLLSKYSPSENQKDVSELLR